MQGAGASGLFDVQTGSEVRSHEEEAFGRVAIT